MNSTNLIRLHYQNEVDLMLFCTELNKGLCENGISVKVDLLKVELYWLHVSSGAINTVH